MSNLSVKLANTAILCSNWFKYIQTNSNTRTAIQDFQTWWTTTFHKQELVDIEIPWIPFPATRWLDSYLRKNMTIFEWGSGASTVFFAKRVKNVVSIEFDYEWYTKVTQILTLKGITNVNLQYIPPQPSSHCQDYSPKELRAYASTNPAYTNMYFVEYAHSIRNYPKNYFDIVLVDGRARLACLKNSVAHVKSDGILLLDNADRQQYQNYDEFMHPNEWKIRSIKGPAPANIWPAFSRTDLFQRIEC